MKKQITLLPGSQDDRPSTPREGLSTMNWLCDGGRQRLARVEPGSDESIPTLFVEELITAVSGWYREVIIEQALSAEDVEDIKADPRYLNTLAERVCAAWRDARSG